MKLLLKTALHPDCLKYLQQLTKFQTNWQMTTPLTPDLSVELRTSTIITSAGASTRIEGATLTDEEIARHFAGLKITSIRDRDDAEVAGYIDAKKYIFSHFADLAISEHTIRSLHQMLMQYLADKILPLNQRGAYKNITNAVVRVDHNTGAQETVFATTPPGPQTDSAMYDLVEDYHAFITDPHFADLEVIAAFIVKFLAIHPFRDGNGRLSRLLTDVCLLQQGYSFCQFASHEKIIEASKPQYYAALRQTQAGLSEGADLNPWFRYFLKTLVQQTDTLQQYIPQTIIGDLSAKEQAVLRVIEQYQPVTMSFLERHSGIKRVTLKAIVTRLKNRTVIRIEGERKASRYWKV